MNKDWYQIAINYQNCELHKEVYIYVYVLLDFENLLPTQIPYEVPRGTKDAS
jgi:hypothetical protein